MRWHNIDIRYSEWREHGESHGSKIDTAAQAARRLTDTDSPPGPWNPGFGRRRCGVHYGNVEQALDTGAGRNTKGGVAGGGRLVENPISTRTRTRTQTNSKNRHGAKLRKMRTKRRAHENEIHWQANGTTTKHLSIL
uniref:HDC09666 n=1 Tax=Drosophila melanogaster TaxID=7227 RepID=Q6ILC8_DROME|nr:TPA_inf: HDC09666 [Drosophila melanogaster]